MDAKPHPRTLLMLVLTGLAASLVGWRSAIVALLCVGAAGMPVPRRWGIRAFSLVGSLLTVLIVLPFAPRTVADIALRGVVASVVLVSFTSCLAWSAAIAELQRLGLPRAAVAFLALLARHVEVLMEDARSTVGMLKIRGAFDRKANIPRAVAVLLSRLLVLAFLRADRVADTMALRGFAGRLPPNAPWRLRIRETRQYALALAMIAVAIWELAR